MIERNLLKVPAVLFLVLIAIVSLHAESKPRFDQYPVKTVFKGKPAPVKLSSAKGARYYRTNLRNAAKEGANFAGRYAIGTWGCGSPCMIGGMVDLKTGKVTWIPQTGADVMDIAFRIDSRLVIINSRDVLNKESPEGPPKWLGDWPEELFFVWNGRRFVQIK